MNVLSFSGSLKRFNNRMQLYFRHVDTQRVTASFADGSTLNAVSRIYVINLDRQPDRWHQLRKELHRFRTQSGTSLLTLVRRFSAVDARYLAGKPYQEVLRPSYTLADQLKVEPNPRLQDDSHARQRHIDMTPQEIAVALSHIEVWKLIASGASPYTLILEDDVYFRHGFARNFDRAWGSLFDKSSIATSPFDLLYLSFNEVGPTDEKQQPRVPLVRTPTRGLWQASGYILSKAGAQKLLDRLPVYGPIDLWLNFQFADLQVLITERPLIDQRVDIASTNSYSILPVLSQVGIFTREKPLLPRAKKLTGPVFVTGKPGSGLTALATSLSMLGYRCISDLTALTAEERQNLFERRKPHFNAYVNIGELSQDSLAQLAIIYPSALFICTTAIDDLLLSPSLEDRTLALSKDRTDKWAELCAFLGLEYPTFPFPEGTDLGQRRLQEPTRPPKLQRQCSDLKHDASPWVLPQAQHSAITLLDTIRHQASSRPPAVTWTSDRKIDHWYWRLRDDTFPSNLSLFTPANYVGNDSNGARLNLRQEITAVRHFTSAAIASKKRYRYGTFSAELMPPCVPGLITGIFLHRNGPRQEIDIEFLGNEPRKMLVNVYYNPGIEGTKLEYGYRGTPTLVDLGFDATKDVHVYEINWSANQISWLVDGLVVYQRTLWDPTPIPDLPMEFNVNLWHTRAKKLAGKLNTRNLPATTVLKSLRIVPSANDEDDVGVYP